MLEKYYNVEWFIVLSTDMANKENQDYLTQYIEIR